MQKENVFLEKIPSKFWIKLKLNHVETTKNLETLYPNLTMVIANKGEIFIVIRICI